MFEAIFFDWAGTTIDFGSCAPASVFMEIFRQRGVEIAVAEAREPMGLAKRAHIEAITRMPRVCEQWMATHGQAPNDGDVQAMYDDFLPLQKEALARGSELIPGTAKVVDDCRSLGIKIGSSTGYTRELMDVVAPLAAQAGYQPDAIVCSDEVPTGRPAADMNLRLAELLGVQDMTRVLVVDDTVVGIEAGLATNSPTLAFTDSGNAMGLTYAEWSQLDESQRSAKRSPIESMFREAGAAYTLPTISDLPSLLGG